VIERVRYEGTARCSRTFEDGGAARIMLSQLGPGVVRGDAFDVRGSVAAGAHLIVTEQAATRVLGGTQPSTYAAHWSVAAGATLELRAEPVIAQAPGEHTIVTEIECEPGAIVMLRDAASVTNGACVRLRTLVRIGGRERFCDSIELRDVSALGTFALIGAACAVEPFDAFAAAAVPAVRVGIGTLRDGIFARVLAPAIWPVREALDGLRVLAERQPASHT
jgi:hypothetical protein